MTDWEQFRIDGKWDSPGIQHRKLVMFMHKILDERAVELVVEGITVVQSEPMPEPDLPTLSNEYPKPNPRPATRAVHKKKRRAKK